MKTYHLTLFKKTTTFSFLGRLLLNHDLLFNRKDKNILYVLPGYCMFFYVFWIFCVKKSVELQYMILGESNTAQNEKKS